MPETKICYDRWIDGKPYPMTYTVCDKCKTRYTDPADAVRCEKSALNPIFKVGESVKLAYSYRGCPSDKGIVLDIKPMPPRKGSEVHNILYRVIFLGEYEDEFFERELISDSK